MDNFWAYKEDAVDWYLSLREFVFRHDGRFFEDWLDRLVVMGVIEQEDWDRENGKFWNIPVCCREWYILLHKFTDYPALIMDKVYGPDNSIGYVRCPDCRRRDNVRFNEY